MVQYKHIIKSIDDYINQSSKLYEAIHPTMMTVFPKEQLKADYRIPPNMTYTDEEYEEDLKWYEDIIIGYYKKYMHRNPKNIPMKLIRTDGVKPYSFPKDNKLMYPNGETITQGALDYGIRNEILLRTSNTPQSKDIILPTSTDFKYQTRYDITLLVKMNKDSMTLTKLNGIIRCDDPILKKNICKRDNQSYNEIYNMKRNNSLEQIFNDVNEKKISYKNAQQEIMEIYVNEINTKYAHKYSESITKDFKDNNIPIETYYIQL